MATAPAVIPRMAPVFAPATWASTASSASSVRPVCLPTIWPLAFSCGTRPSGYFGEECTACPGGAEVPCSGVGECSAGKAGTGVCTCDTGYTGVNCELCLPGYFGPTCLRKCSVLSKPLRLLHMRSFSLPCRRGIPVQPKWHLLRRQGRRWSLRLQDWFRIR